MRTISTEQEFVYDADARSEHLKVSIKDSSGSWIDYTDLVGYNWIDSANWSDDIDSLTAMASVTLLRDYDNYSLAPLMTESPLNNIGGSYDPLIALGREIKIEIAVVPFETEPASGDYINVFQGHINDMDTAGRKIKLDCRDLGGKLLLDNFIEDQREYGSAAGIAVQTVMQSILTDNSTGVTLYTPTSPGWNIVSTHDKTFLLDKQPVLEALQMLANQIGWIVKYRWDSGTSAWRLTLYAPDRTKAGGTDRVFGVGEYRKISQNKESTKNVRNKIQVIYFIGNDIERDKRTYVASDATSISKYGTRFMEIVEASTSQINSAAEAQTMADNILDDLKEPDLIQNIELFGFIHVETGDIYEFEADDENYDTNQTLAVKSWRQAYSGGKLVTTVNVQGNPSAGVRRWLGIEGRPGVGPTADLKGPQRSTQITTMLNSQQGLGPMLLSQLTERATMIGNGDFAVSSRVTTGSGWPPDGWEMVAGTWGSSSDVYVDTTNILTAGRSLHFRNTATTPVTVKSDLFPVTEADLYVGSAWIKSSSTDVSDNVQIYIEYYQADKTTSVSTVDWYNQNLPSSAGWVQTDAKYLKVPSNARWARIFIVKATSTAHNLYVDSVRLKRAKEAFYMYRSSSQSIPDSTSTVVDFDTTSFDTSGGVDLANNRYQPQNPGIYMFVAAALFTGQSDNKRGVIELQSSTNGTTWTQLSWTEFNTNSQGRSRPFLVTAAFGKVNIAAGTGNYFRIRVFHDEGGGTAKSISGGATDTYFAGIQIEQI